MIDKESILAENFFANSFDWWVVAWYIIPLSVASYDDCAVFVCKPVLKKTFTRFGAHSRLGFLGKARLNFNLWGYIVIV